MIVQGGSHLVLDPQIPHPERLAAGALGVYSFCPQAPLTCDSIHLYAGPEARLEVTGASFDLLPIHPLARQSPSGSLHELAQYDLSHVTQRHLESGSFLDVYLRNHGGDAQPLLLLKGRHRVRPAFDSLRTTLLSPERIDDPTQPKRHVLGARSAKVVETVMPGAGQLTNVVVTTNAAYGQLTLSSFLVGAVSLLPGYFELPAEAFVGEGARLESDPCDGGTHIRLEAKNRSDREDLWLEFTLEWNRPSHAPSLASPLDALTREYLKGQLEMSRDFVRAVASFHASAKP